MGKMASVLAEVDEAEARPFGRCESGTRIGLCLRIDFFFCDFPMIVTVQQRVRGCCKLEEESKEDAVDA